MPAPQDITFCVHCRNRLDQLKKTLPENLAVISRYPNVGMTLLNYNSADNLHDWARSKLAGEISSGKLIYARETRSRIFHCSKSKNLAHKLAHGRFLVNLDADNFIGDTIPLIVENLARHPRLVLRTWTGEFTDGTCGRIGIHRRDFHRLGGYDESFLPMGFQDLDLIIRARAIGIPLLDVRCDAKALPNPKSRSIKHIGEVANRMTWEEMNLRNMNRSQRNRANGKLRANPNGWARAEVEINFTRRTVL